MPKRGKDFDTLCRALFLSQSEIGRLFELSEEEARLTYRKADQVDKRTQAADRVVFDNKVRRTSVLKVLGFTENDIDVFFARKKQSELLRTDCKG
jgi:DUF1365 family protein